MQTIINKSSSLLLAMALIFIFSSCDKTEDETFIRVHNSSSYEYEDLIVVSFGNTMNYGTLESASYSEYKTFEHASNIASINLKIEDKDFYYFSPSWIGEHVLSPGNYTYVIGVENFEDGTLSFEVKKD